MPFRLTEHTADVGIEATGPDAGSALADAGSGLAAVLTGLEDPCGLAADEVVAVAAEAPDLPALAVAFLAELLWRFDSEGLLWTGGEAAVGRTPEGAWRVRATGAAARPGPGRLAEGTEVKAVTYHGLEFGRHGKTWRLRVVLDI